MIPGAPVESRWLSSEPRRDWPLDVLERMVRARFPAAQIMEAQPFTQGRRNVNFKLTLSTRSAPIVLRIYQHDASLCQKEVDILRLIKSDVPVPGVIHAETETDGNLPPFVLMDYLHGISFRELIRGGNSQAIAQAAHSAGETLAHIGRFHFNKGGWLGPGPAPGAPLMEGTDPIPRFVDACLAHAALQSRLPEELRDQAHALVWSSRDMYAELDGDCCLVHGDFNKRNLLVAQIAGTWRITAVLDWEFAIAGSPLGDFGNLLRYEKKSQPLLEPHFSAGYMSAGGRLPSNWLRRARLLDLIALCESLTRAQLPEDVITELIELVRSTVEDRDPSF